LIPPESLPVTVTHLSSKGKIEKIQLSSESSSVSPSTRKVKETEISAEPEKDETKEIMITEAPVKVASFASTASAASNRDTALSSINQTQTNPFSNPFIKSEPNNSNPFDDDYDQITSILINSTNPFHNPFLMSAEVSESGQEGEGVPSKLQSDEQNGCTKTPFESVSLC
jgi:hypothetical protein